MQNLAAIIRQPIIAGLLLSIAAHGMVLRRSALFSAAAPKMETGRTVVHLTLLPSISKPKLPLAETRDRRTREHPQPLPAPVPDAVPEPAISRPGEDIASVEMDATSESSKGITSEATATGLFRPAYPRMSRRRGEEGTVTMSIQVLADGTTGQVEITASSGHRRLDEAAVNAARKTAYTPALLLGRTIESTIELSYTFRLTDD